MQFSATTATRSRRWTSSLFPTATFRILYVWFAIDSRKRRVLHFDVTTGRCRMVVQQLREAFPHGQKRHFHLLLQSKV